MQYAQVPVVPGPVVAVSPTIVDTDSQGNMIAAQWHACGDAVKEQWTFDGNTFRAPPPPPAQAPPVDPVMQMKQGAYSALVNSDTTVLRCLAAGIAVPADWISYRAALRAIVTSGVGPLPTMPGYPAGT